MNNRERQAEGITSTTRMAQQPDRAPQASVNASSPVMWQASSVRVPPVLGNPTGVLRIQQLKGNRTVGQMLAVQRDTEAQGLREPSDEEIHSAAAEGIRTPATTLPFLDRIQASFGRHSVGHVKAHVGPEAVKASRGMNALAFASGDHVVFGGTPDLWTTAHEAAHVVQQQAGAQLAGGIGREGDAYERHADAVADEVVAGRSAEGLLKQFAPDGPHQQLPKQLRALASLGAIQRAVDLTGLQSMKHGSPPTFRKGDWYYKVYSEKERADEMKAAWDTLEPHGIPLPSYGVEKVTMDKVEKWAFCSRHAKGAFFQASKTIAPLKAWVEKQDNPEILRRAYRILGYVQDNLGDAQGFVVAEPGFELKFIDINLRGTSPGLGWVLTKIEEKQKALKPKQKIPS